MLEKLTSLPHTSTFRSPLNDEVDRSEVVGEYSAALAMLSNGFFQARAAAVRCVGVIITSGCLARTRLQTLPVPFKCTRLSAKVSPSRRHADNYFN